jgi:hypothetical protein
MSNDLVSTLSAVVSTLVIAIGAVAAIVQLRHLRASNELDGIIALEENFRNAEMQAALRYIQTELPLRLEDSEYRAMLARRGFIDTHEHPELIVCNWCNTLGTLVKHHVVSEEMFMDLFARLIIFTWRNLEPVVAIMRRTRGEVQYHDFEYIAIRAERWLAQHPAGSFPKGHARRTIADPWHDVDEEPTVS